MIKNMVYLPLILKREQVYYLSEEIYTNLTNEYSSQLDLNKALQFTNFYDFLNSISLSLQPFIKTINLNTLNLSKDYEFISLNNSLTNKDNNSSITFISNNITSNIITNKHASKTINKILTKEEALTLSYGTKMHELLENTNFLLNNNNKYIKALQNTFNFKNANIYQELEFIFEEEKEEYHGIIDLMLEYPTEIKIIDYKLKNINDEAYNKQLNIYYKYIKSISPKKISLYLYSLLDNELK